MGGNWASYLSTHWSLHRLPAFYNRELYRILRGLQHLFLDHQT